MALDGPRHGYRAPATDTTRAMWAIKLMKAFSIWRLEKASLGRGLFRLGFGCTANKKQQRKHKE